MKKLLPPLIMAAFFLTGFDNAISATDPPSESHVTKGAFQSAPVTPFIFRGDLRDLPKPKTREPGDPIIEIPRRIYPRPEPDSISSRGETAVGGSKRDTLTLIQEHAPIDNTPRVFTTPDLNFAGIGFTNVAPPDTVGEVGANYYIQMVNGIGGSQVSIYDKTGTQQAGPFELDSLWTAGGLCGNGLGDPVVLFDGLASRWLMSEFSTFGSRLCVYISQTSDPILGGWFLYEFDAPEFPDYPKYAVWPDAYYVSSNESSPAIYALDRDQMLDGLPATFQRFTASSLPAFPFQALIPSDLDGLTPPPVGSPNYFMRHRDGEANGDPPDAVNDILEIWEFHIEWGTPANSTLTGPINLLVSEFDSDLCGLISFECFPQPDPTFGLDPLREVIMWRLQYRNFGTHESLVGNFVTDVDGTDHGGIRWFELRKTDPGPWTLFQEGTYAPDSDNRWMGSIAMDGSGNIALGYSVSSTVTFPSIRYTGRLSIDPLGTMTQGETVLMAGSGSQTFSERWGDYSSMNVDPVDDCTFWYTNEYVPANGNWETQIGSFKFSSCTTSPFGTLEGIISNNSTTNPINNVEVTAGAFTEFTDATGFYQFSQLPVGTYDVTADAGGFSPNTINGVSITDGGTTLLDIDLTPLPPSTLTVTKTGLGTGLVTSSPAGIDCGSDCDEIYASETTVTLTATPDGGSTFGGWTGDADCTDGIVTMNTDISCTANFTFSSLIGDIDGSGRVDGFDLGVLGLAFGSQSGDINWNPASDLNIDGIVDNSDLILLESNFGKTF